MTHFAAVGTDGLRPVVWGIGDSRDEALVDAGRSFGQSDIDPKTEPLVIVEITARQRRSVLDGEVSTTELGIVLGEGDLRTISEP